MNSSRWLTVALLTSSLSGCGGPAPSGDASSGDAGATPDALAIDAGDTGSISRDGGGGDARDAAVPIDPALEAFLNDATTGFCAATNACLRENGGFYPVVECERVVADLLRGLDPSRVVLDPSRQAACLAAIEAAPCAAYSILQDGCEGALSGTMALGDPCASDVECMGAASCAGPSGECPRCVADASHGEDCTVADCEDGVGCVAIGGSAGSTTTCESLAGEGEGCSGHHCTDGLFCEVTPTGSRCAPIVTVSEGEACGPGAGRFCAAGLVCSAAGDGACHAPPALTDACVRLWYGDFCPEGSFCDADTAGHCVPDVSEGAPCAHFDSCVAGAYCIGSVCTRRGSPGSACVEGPECTSHVCAAGVCARAVCE